MIDLMWVAMFISWILGVVVAGSLCLWVGLACRLRVISRTKATIREGLSLPVPTGESVSIVVPAHNEERVIDRCATLLREQSHQEIEIIFVLDRCTDGTHKLLQKHADEDPRIRIIENDQCPDDWSGKCHAAQIGATEATYNWLLFTDADTQFDQELVRCAVASAIKRKASLLSILSTLTITKTFERIVQPIASTFLVRQFPVDRINSSRRARPFANGQFLLFSRDAYEEIGGHESVKKELLEDIAFAKLICRKTEGKVQVLFADGLLKCSMYSTFAAFRSGWKRIYIEAHNRNVKKLKRSASTALIVGVALPLAGIAGMVMGYFNSQPLFWTSAASLVAFIFVIAWLYKINGAPVVFAVFSPIGAVVVAQLLLEAASMLQRGEPIRWGGREYVLEPK